MRQFARLLSEIEQTNSTAEKVDLMARFFKAENPEASAWALYFLSGQRPKKFLSSKLLRAWAEELADLPAWLSEDCYGAVGDTAEMIALVVAPYKKATTGEIPDLSVAEWMRDRIEPLKQADEPVQKATIQKWWTELSTRETYVVNKLLTGALRIGVSETLVYRALSQAFGVPRPTLAARLLGKWTPSAEFFSKITRAPAADEAGSPAPAEETDLAALPVPFCLAASLETKPAELGDIADWQIEWKWDGIRAQAVKHGEHVEIWSRGEERVTESFPDLVALFARIPGNFTLDGEILAGEVAQPGSFNDLQKRLNRKLPSPALLKASPVSFTAYDLLREGEARLAESPLRARRAALEAFIKANGSARLGISTLLTPANWAEAEALQARARAERAEGLMLKRKNAPYATGRKRGIWFKWKVDPLTLDVVLTAAQPGSGRRASLYTDYTFGIWSGDRLVPIMKAYSGLTDEEIRELDQWIRRNTLERHGPVRTVKPERVFELGFEGISESTRHKSGFAVRFPRILRERKDKPVAEADRVESARALFESLRDLPAATPRKGPAEANLDLFGNAP